LGVSKMPREKAMLSILKQRISFFESDLSNHIRKAIEKTDLKTYKIKTDAVLGMPDIYTTGGNWLESKIERRIPGPGFSPLKLFTGSQRRELDQLTDAGDGTWACVAWAYDALDQRIGILPWYYFRRIRLWPLKTVHYFTEPYTDSKSIGGYIRNHLIVNRKLSMKPFMERFDAWPDREDKSYFNNFIRPVYGDDDFDDYLTMHKRNQI